jgi:uncharacterized protein
MSTEISDEILGAYVDNELDPAERAAILESLAVDGALRGRACELWQLKQMVRGAYPLPKQQSPAGSRTPGAPSWSLALAASLLLAIGTVSGWFMHGRIDAEQLATQQIEALQAEGARVVIHLFSDEPARMEAALDMAERLADARDGTGQPLRVEFIANGPGLHLLRTDGSAYAARISHLSHHPNLRLIACREAMGRLRERGIDVTLLPGVEEATSAENQLATRLTQGWKYIQS